MDDTQKQNYELAFHINPNLEEAKVRQNREDIDKLITSHGGVVTFTREPEKTRLSYPIRHERSAFFSYIQFSLSDTSKLAEIEEQLRLNNDIIRYLMLKLQTDEERIKAMAKLAENKDKRERRAKKMQTAKPEDTAKMESQLEEIISGL